MFCFLTFNLENGSGIGYEWQLEVMKQVLDKDIELVRSWVEKGLPQGMVRAELRAHLKERMNLEAKNKT